MTPYMKVFYAPLDVTPNMTVAQPDLFHLS